MNTPAPAFDALELFQILVAALMLLPTLLIASPIMLSCVACQGCQGLIRKLRARTHLATTSA